MSWEASACNLSNWKGANCINGIGMAYLIWCPSWYTLKYVSHCPQVWFLIHPVLKTSSPNNTFTSNCMVSCIVCHNVQMHWIIFQITSILGAGTHDDISSFSAIKMCHSGIVGPGQNNWKNNQSRVKILLQSRTEWAVSRLPAAFDKCRLIIEIWAAKSRNQIPPIHKRALERLHGFH